MYHIVNAFVGCRLKYVNDMLSTSLHYTMVNIVQHKIIALRAHNCSICNTVTANALLFVMFGIIVMFLVDDYILFIHIINFQYQYKPQYTVYAYQHLKRLSMTINKTNTQYNYNNRCSSHSHVNR